MTFNFKPANSYTDRHGLFVALVGGTNSGKTFSALRLARGIVGPQGKIAVADTEAGRTLHLKHEFNFDVAMMDSPHRPSRYADLAKHAEQKGYGALVIDSFSAEWAGQGGVLSWADDEAARMAGDDEAKRERIKGATWIRPKSAHKAMVYSFLERRMPIIFSIRGEETFIPPNQKVFKPICNKLFLFEVTVSFRLASEKKGIIDLSDPKSWKMEGSHRDIFKDGEQLSERHGELLAQWAGGAAVAKPAQTPGTTNDMFGDTMTKEAVQKEVRRIKGAAIAAKDDLDLDMLLQRENVALERIKAASVPAYEHAMEAIQQRRTDLLQAA